MAIKTNAKKRMKKLGDKVKEARKVMKKAGKKASNA
jgi:hypothetical protein